MNERRPSLILGNHNANQARLVEGSADCLATLNDEAQVGSSTKSYHGMSQIVSVKLEYGQGTTKEATGS